MSLSFRRLLRPAVLAVTLAGGLAALAPQVARADSFSFSYSNGWHRGPWYGPPPHRHYHDAYWDRHYWGPPAYRPRVVIVNPPPVTYYTPPPPVVYAPYNGGQISAVPASPVYQTTGGQYCREYQAQVIVNGQPQPSYGTACLGPDGAWRVVN